MNKKTGALALVIILFVLISGLIVYIFSELFTEEENNKNNDDKPTVVDAQKFKEDYESLNGKKNGDNTIRSIEIDEDNPFIYKTAEDIVKMIDDKETFVVYFGFAKCPWCRSVLPSMIKEAKANKIDKIYYVDVLDIRDKYELDDNHKAVKTVEGTKGYNDLLDRLGSVLSDYSPLTYTNSKKKEVKVKIKEKRIYAPNVVIVKNGKAIALEEGISKKQKDPYQKLDKTITCEMEEKFKCLFEKVNSDDNACSVNDPIC